MSNLEGGQLHQHNIKGNQKNNTKTYVIGVIGAIFWGISFLGTKVSMSYLEPAGLMAARMVVAVFFMGLMILFGLAKVRYTKKYLWTMIFLALLQPCFYGLMEAMGVRLTTASESAILLAFLPLVTTLMAAIVLKEKITRIQWGFIALSFLGVVVTVVFAEDFSVGGKLLGYGFLLLAVLSGSLYSIFARQVSETYTPFEVTFVMSVVGLVFFNVVNAFQGNGLESYQIIFAHPKLIAIVVFLGLVCSVISFLAFNYLIARIPAYKAAVLTISVLTVTGVVAGIVILGEPATWYKIVGMIIIVAGVIGTGLGGANTPDAAGRKEIGDPSGMKGA
jgi:drug/metabolite transporter (DMT)-like permease